MKFFFLSIQRMFKTYLFKKCTIELHNIWALIASHHHFKVHQQLFLLFFINSGPNTFHSHNSVRSKTDFKRII